MGQYVLSAHAERGGGLWAWWPRKGCRRKTGSPFAVAVVVGVALRRGFIALGTDLPTDLQFHQRLGQKSQTFPESIELAQVSRD